ncbi:hypothetical protein XENOCAPTIV_000724 [Xenoophorus captivus]|uniref:Uncharacterized protein n=1 Tax=Xenoophorus captivus TaxID=1517983 RepID=A0ABV0RMY5_9TELE
MIALQARMQASYQDHVAQTQRLNAKDQLEKGPNAQLARLQQENSILRDALNQATSQAESKQNAELAKLRQECAKLTKELGEKTESLLADEQVRKGLESKLSAAEKQLSLLQVGPACGNGTFLLYIHETYSSFYVEADFFVLPFSVKPQCRVSAATWLLSKTKWYQVRIERLEAEVKERSAQVDTLTVQLEETQVEKNQLTQQVASINSLLEASQNKQDDDSKQEKLKESEANYSSLQADCDQYRTVLAETVSKINNNSMDRSEHSWARSRRGRGESRTVQLRLNPVRSGCEDDRAPFTSCQRVSDSDWNSTPELRLIRNEEPLFVIRFWLISYMRPPSMK